MRRCGGVALRWCIAAVVVVAFRCCRGATNKEQVCCVRAWQCRTRGPPLLPFLLVNVATCGRFYAYARRSLVELKLVCGGAHFCLLVSYSTLASVFVHPLLRRIGAKEFESYV